MFANRTWVGIVMAAMMMTASAASCAPSPGGGARAAPAEALLAHPVVKGAAGPFRSVVVTLSRQPGEREGVFHGSCDAGSGKRFALPAPDEPADFFILQPKAVMFTPIEGGRANGIVVLYDSSQIGPQHGTEHRALVYRVTATGAERMPAIEARLEGVRTAAVARARLAGRR